jgi:pimeloyl-ACP methyl ester carboxylesterase
MHRSITVSTALRAAALALLLGAASGQALAQDSEHGKGHHKEHRRIVIEEQGSFAFGGRVVTDATDSTLHCDHGYAEFQTPINARALPIIMWHSTRTKTWTSTPGGVEGFQDIFLRRGYSVYIIDLPRQGRAGNACINTTYTANPGQDQTTFRNWLLGTWQLPGPPTYFPHSQAPRDTAFLNQVLRARYPDNENFEDTDSLEASDVGALLDKIGPATLMTHSGSGRYGWLTALGSPKVKGIVSFEPVTFVFPSGELPPPVDGGQPQLEVPAADFQKLTQIPIQVIFGDFLDQLPLWTASFANAKAFVAALNRHGGHAELLYLPDLGIHGNSHIMMLERNNVQIANLVSQFLRENGLARRGGRGRRNSDVATH